MNNMSMGNLKPFTQNEQDAAHPANAQKKPELVQLKNTSQANEVVNSSALFVFRDITHRTGTSAISDAELAQRRNTIEQLRYIAGE
jgi:hypothetical protein